MCTCLDCAGSNYQGAAERFLEISVDMKDRYKDVITCKDVAVYGALCALASYSRHDLKTKVGVLFLSHWLQSPTCTLAAPGRQQH